MILGVLLHAMIRQIRTNPPARSQCVGVIQGLRRVALLCSEPPPAYIRITLIRDELRETVWSNNKHPRQEQT
jgi:hypothetical protein